MVQLKRKCKAQTCSVCFPFGGMHGPSKACFLSKKSLTFFFFSGRLSSLQSLVLFSRKKPHVRRHQERKGSLKLHHHLDRDSKGLTD